MQQLQQSGGFGIADAALEQARACFIADRADEATTKATMQAAFASTGTLVDPHTAVGLAVAKQHRGAASVPMVTLSTAHPAKFPAAVEEACHKSPELPTRMADIFSRPERMDELPNDLAAVENFIRARARAVAV